MGVLCFSLGDALAFIVGALMMVNAIFNFYVIFKVRIVLNCSKCAWCVVRVVPVCPCFVLYAASTSLTGCGQISARQTRRAKTVIQESAYLFFVRSWAWGFSIVVGVGGWRWWYCRRYLTACGIGHDRNKDEI